VVTVATFFILLIPISITIAVIRYRLWDINPIINRTLVYGALSASTIALYVVAVGFFSNYFQNSRVNFVVSFIATGVVAILFEPLRERLQRAVNRLMYGERDDPATVATLSQRLDSALARFSFADYRRNLAQDSATAVCRHLRFSRGCGGRTSPHRGNRTASVGGNSSSPDISS
jgi:hypothetical protein